MAVYVDDMEAPFRRMVMCHCIADTRKELLDMMTKIGMNHKWIQQKDTAQEHFDICKSMRAKAVKLGAVELTQHQLAEITFGRRGIWNRDIYLGHDLSILTPPAAGGRIQRLVEADQGELF